MRNKFIVIEGISGSGKTTISRRLASELGGYYYSTPECYQKLRPIADNILTLQERLRFYLSLNLQTFFEISDLLEKKGVVCDKYVWTTICYHRAMGLIFPDSIYPKIFYPDFCFLLLCDDQKRLRRISKRDPINDLSKDTNRQTLERKCLVEFKKRLSHCIVDNSIDDPLIATNTILQKIK